MQAIESSRGALATSTADSPPLIFIILICGVATIGGFLFGFDSGVINGTVTGLQQAFNSNTAGTGFNVASMLLGCAVGAFFAGRLADRWGRRQLLLIAALFFVVSAWGEADALLINIISGAVSIGACLIAMALIDHIGRKPLLLAGSIGMAITLGLVAYAFTSASVDMGGQLQLSRGMGLLALVAANAYVFFFNASWGPAMWTMLGEMFPNQIRGSGLAVSGLAQWGANFAIIMTFPIMLAGIGLAGAYAFTPCSRYCRSPLSSIWCTRPRAWSRSKRAASGPCDYFGN